MTMTEDLLVRTITTLLEENADGEIEYQLTEEAQNTGPLTGTGPIPTVEVRRVCTFEDAMILTPIRGLVVSFSDGSKFRVAITRDPADTTVSRPQPNPPYFMSENAGRKHGSR